MCFLCSPFRNIMSRMSIEIVQLNSETVVKVWEVNCGESQAGKHVSTEVEDIG
jgi:hypothetical protein